MNFLKEGLSEDCEKEKLTRAVYISKISNTNTEAFKLIHMDLFGRVNFLSLDKKRYALIMLDNYSRYIWVKFLLYKVEATKDNINYIKTLERTPNYKV